MRTSRKPKRQQKTRIDFRVPPPPPINNVRAARAAVLDRLADAELQHGHRAAAERLAPAAAALRDAVR